MWQPRQDFAKEQWKHVSLSRIQMYSCRNNQGEVGLDPHLLNLTPDHGNGKSGRSGSDIGSDLGRRAYEAIGSQVSQLEAMLGRDSDIGVTIPSANDFVHIYLRNFALADLEFICFLGIDTKGRNVRLLQHVTQLSAMLVEVPKRGKIAFRIGGA